eukprot:4738282-Prymnesium_polylepis.2
MLVQDLRDELRTTIKEAKNPELISRLAADLASLEPGAPKATNEGRRFDNSDWHALLRKFAHEEKGGVDREVEQALLRLSIISEVPHSAQTCASASTAS